jgi:hypothetical protein
VRESQRIKADRLSELMNNVRHVMNNVRHERRATQIGVASTRARGHWPKLAASVVFVFVCFFAIGRTIHSGGASQAETPATLQAASVTASVPEALSDASPAGGPIPIALARPASRRAHPQANAQPITVGTDLAASAPIRQSLTATAPETTPPPPQRPSPSAPVATPAPAPAPAPSRPAAHRGSSGGGSFDSSE